MRRFHVNPVVVPLAILITGMSMSLASSSEPGYREASLETGQELRVTTDCEANDEVAVSIQNRGDGACKCSMEAFKNGERLSDNEFASFAGSTFEVQKNYKKIVGFDCVMDEFVVRIDEGKADIRVSQISYE